MNATELFHQDGRSAGVFYCGKCNNFAGSRETAEACCVPKKCQACSAVVEKARARFHTVCQACEDAARLIENAKRFEEATKLTEWPGPVLAEGIDHNEGHFKSVAELLDWCHGIGLVVPAFAYTCQEEPVVSLDLDNIEHCIEGYEGFEFRDLEGLEELKAALDKFNELNTGQIAYSTDCKTVVLIPSVNPHLTALIHLVAIDNGISAKPTSEWQWPPDAGVMEAVAAQFTQEQKETVVQGEHMEAQEILVKFEQGVRLDEFLNAVFDGAERSNFYANE